MKSIRFLILSQSKTIFVFILTGFPTGIRETQIKVVDNDKCMKTILDVGITDFTIPDSMFCTTSLKELNSTNTKACDVRES